MLIEMLAALFQVATLPGNAAVEVEAIFEIRD